ncbi:MAG: 50S ribosomal protein L11 methyltransferase [Cytophagaceae bacterium]|nr:50S ribosomal protein L11 methyltransferase [Cytophagaceae bacterium]MDW8456165.1 50S ribosomal protein L11 methyltransferase [Cytophagaceae bacterium]
MNWIEVSIHTTSTELAEILLAELSESGYDSFLETPYGIDAYIKEELYDETVLFELKKKYSVIFPFSYTVKIIPQKNWNEEWEKNFEPVVVANRCIVRPPFFTPMETFPYDIVIQPKMSFGTGHHATTQMMAEFLIENPPAKQRVLDIGTGTGILAILAEKLGANHVDAVDNDPICFENCNENCTLNACNLVQTYLGDVRTAPISKTGYDVLLANITKNVLLDEFDNYYALMNHGATLYISGFYETDQEDLKCAAIKSGFVQLSKKNKNDWAAMAFKKI